MAFNLTANQQHVLERLAAGDGQRPAAIADDVTDYGAVTRALDSLSTWRMVERELFATTRSGDSYLYRITEHGRDELAFALNSQPNRHGFMLRTASDNSWQVNRREPFAKYLDSLGFEVAEGVTAGEDVRWVRDWLIIAATANNCLYARGQHARQVRVLLTGLAKQAASTGE